MKQSAKSRLSRILMWVCILALSILSLFPFFWMIRSSLMTKTEIFGTPMKWWPKEIQWQNYRDAMTQVPFARYFVNSLFLVAVKYAYLGRAMSESHGKKSDPVYS